jgi:hypothetical protein
VKDDEVRGDKGTRRGETRRGARGEMATSRGLHKFLKRIQNSIQKCLYKTLKYKLI